MGAFYLRLALCCRRDRYYAFDACTKRGAGQWSASIMFRMSSDMTKREAEIAPAA